MEKEALVNDQASFSRQTCFACIVQDPYEESVQLLH
jgi:hypothetical protein